MYATRAFLGTDFNRIFECKGAGLQNIERDQFGRDRDFSFTAGPRDYRESRGIPRYFLNRPKSEERAHIYSYIRTYEQQRFSLLLMLEVRLQRQWTDWYASGAGSIPTHWPTHRPCTRPTPPVHPLVAAAGDTVRPTEPSTHWVVPTPSAQKTRTHPLYNNSYYNNSSTAVVVPSTHPPTSIAYHLCTIIIVQQSSTACRKKNDPQTTYEPRICAVPKYGCMAVQQRKQINQKQRRGFELARQDLCLFRIEHSTAEPKDVPGWDYWPSPESANFENPRSPSLAATPLPSLEITSAGACVGLDMVALSRGIGWRPGPSDVGKSYLDNSIKLKIRNVITTTINTVNTIITIKTVIFHTAVYIRSSIALRVRRQYFFLEIFAV